MVYRWLSCWFRKVSERFRPVATISLSRFQFLSLKHYRCWFENFSEACEGDEGKLENLHTFNAAGPHKTDVAVLELKGKKSGDVFNIIYPTGAINEINP